MGFMETAQHIESALVTHVTEHPGMVHPKRGQMANSLLGHINATCAGGGFESPIRRFALGEAVSVDEMNARMSEVWPCGVCITTGTELRAIPELDVPDPTPGDGGCKPKATRGVESDEWSGKTATDVETWLAIHNTNGVKVDVTEVTPALAKIATEWAKVWDGDFAFMVDMRDAAKSRRTGLSIGQAKSVLNCWKADLARRPKVAEKTSPVPAVAAVDYSGIPAGRYAFTAEEGHTAFCQVDQGKGKWAGRTFCTLLVGAPGGFNEQRMGRDASQAILAKIAVDPRAAALRFGHEVGECPCCKSPLTNPDSIAAGIGPVCAKKRSW